MKHESGKYKAVTENKIKALSGYGVKLPLDAVQITNSSDFIDPRGNVYSFGVNNPQGIIRKIYYRPDSYPQVSVYINGESVTRDIHHLLADTFIYPGYVSHGLCVLHKDNNKHNFSLDNLSVDTYSKNNRDAYKDGVNQGNINGIIKTERNQNR